MVLFIDGFDGYNSYTDMFKKWYSGNTGSQWSFPAGRYGGKCALGNNGFAIFNFKSSSTVIIGFGLYIPTMPFAATDIVSLYDMDDRHVTIRLESTGKIETTVETSPGSLNIAISPPSTIRPNTFHYIEVKFFANPVSGYTETRVDSETVATYTGKTIYYNRSTINSLRIGGQGYSYDDFYIADDLGTTNNDFLGDIKMIVHTPTGTGRVQEWITSGISSSTHAISGMDEDATYIHTESVSGASLFTFSPVSSGCMGITATQLILGVRKSTPGQVSAAGLVGNGTIENVTSTFGLWDTYYGYKTFIYDNDPFTLISWTPSNFNNRQFGIIAKP